MTRPAGHVTRVAARRIGPTNTRPRGFRATCSTPRGSTRTEGGRRRRAKLRPRTDRKTHTLRATQRHGNSVEREMPFRVHVLSVGGHVITRPTKGSVPVLDRAEGKRVSLPQEHRDSSMGYENLSTCDTFSNRTQGKKNHNDNVRPWLSSSASNQCCTLYYSPLIVLRTGKLICLNSLKYRMTSNKCKE